MPTRYEILPFGSVEEEAAALPPTVITVTCSPRHGIDHSVDLAVRLAERGHDVVVHLAARTILGLSHLDLLLERIDAAGIDDLFVIGGDGEPQGPFTSAVQLLPLIAAHERRPAQIGIGAYPEGHPLVDTAALDAALAEKAAVASYMTTQLCFDARAIGRWIETVRARGIALPVYVGIPGIVSPRRLLEVSARVGVGASIRYLRKQQGVRRLMRRSGHAIERLDDAVTALAQDPETGIVGRHLYTFNQLLATVEWETARHGAHALTRKG